MATATQKGKVSVKVHGADGQAYFMTVDAKHLTAPDAKSETEFASIVTILSIPSDPIPEPSILKNPEAIEYFGWLVIEEEETVKDMTSASDLNVSITPQLLYRSQRQNPPFWMDTGVFIFLQNSQISHPLIPLHLTLSKSWVAHLLLPKELAQSNFV